MVRYVEPVTRPIPCLTMAEMVEDDGATPEVEVDPDGTPAAPVWTGACGVCGRPFAHCPCGWDDGEITKETETP